VPDGSTLVARTLAAGLATVSLVSLGPARSSRGPSDKFPPGSSAAGRAIAVVARRQGKFFDIY